VEPDVDCTCVGFDGERLWATQRARLSYNFRRISTSQKNFDLRRDYESRLVKYSRRGFYICEPKLEDWGKVSYKYMQIGKNRLTRLKGCRETPDTNWKDEREIRKESESRIGVIGLRLLLLGFKYPELRDCHSVFKMATFKEYGMPYGPKWKVHNIEKKLKEPTFESSSYGPVEIDSPFNLVVKLHEEMSKIKLFT